jgi:hypothetical protein
MSATRYRAAHSCPSSRSTASTGPYNIIGQLGATTAKIDFRTLLDISPKVRQELREYLDNEPNESEPSSGLQQAGSNHTAALFNTLPTRYTVARCKMEISDKPVEAILDSGASTTVLGQMNMIC